MHDADLGVFPEDTLMASSPYDITNEEYQWAQEQGAKNMQDVIDIITKHKQEDGS